MNARWLILADDLTGAADAAVGFARRGYATEVMWGTSAVGDDADVVARDLGTRGLPAAEAAARHRDALQRWRVPAQTLFKKIDSTLRGQPAAEIAALAAALRAHGQPSWGLLAPANPAMRRTVRDGRVFVDELPLESTSTWAREHTYPNADLADIVRSVGLRAAHLPTAALRDGVDDVRDIFAAAAAPSQEADTILICDAETNEDLASIVEAARLSVPGFFIGTAGLAQALARASSAASRSVAPTVAMPQPRGTLVAVGTMADVSRRAARRLVARDGLDLMTVIPHASSGSPTRGCDDAAARLARGETVVAMLEASDDPDRAPDPRHAVAFAEALSDALVQMGALVVTGGETAATLLARCGARGIRLVDEVAPGLALGITTGAVAVPIVTKPGAFGDDDSLCGSVDAVAALGRTA